MAAPPSEAPQLFVAPAAFIPIALGIPIMNWPFAGTGFRTLKLTV